ncbi:LysR family transcriptional regulator (plasmid) [Microvirga sp. VF16]|nr:LysR family transcriptional regulator [Microvirga sp. VF16]QRM33324.1 LysR family transcriptional regulator [Microvirga sp. VF16]
MLWDDIRYFLALARSGSLSGASRALGVEHSTVARRVSQLESELEVRLFDRLARGWTLTTEGGDLLSRAEAVEQEVLALRRAATGVDMLSGTVRISAPPLLLSHLILPGLCLFSAAHPGIGLELVGERREADLVRGEADIAIRLGRPSEASLVVRSLGEISYGLYGLAAEVERPRAEQVYIGFDDSMPDLPQKLWLDEYVGGRRFSIKSNDMATMLQAALGGLGIALLPEFLASPHESLRPLEAETRPPVRPVFLVMHPDIRRSRRVRLIADHLTQALSQ